MRNTQLEDTQTNQQERAHVYIEPHKPEQVHTHAQQMNMKMLNYTVLCWCWR